MYNIIGYHPHYLDDTARLYQTAYAVRDQEQQSGYEVSRDVVESNAKRNGSIGVIAVDAEQQVIGMMSGFDTPSHNERVARIVKKRIGEEWLEQTLLVDTFGMHFEHLSEALALDLAQGVLERATEEGYERVRIRIDMPRMDNLPAILENNGWHRFESLNGLGHVLWMGKNI